VLLLRRAAPDDHAGEWSLPGGKIRDDETPQQAAIREVWEEYQYRAGHAGRWHTRRVKEGVDAVTFIYDCEDEWTPKLNKEHDNFVWLTPAEALKEKATP
jgi:8-oxo-dGTP diphosphatase